MSEAYFINPDAFGINGFHYKLATIWLLTTGIFSLIHSIKSWLKARSEKNSRIVHRMLAQIVTSVLMIGCGAVMATQWSRRHSGWIGGVGVVISLALMVIGVINMSTNSTRSPTLIILATCAVIFSVTYGLAEYRSAS